MKMLQFNNKNSRQHKLTEELTAYDKYS